MQAFKIKLINTAFYLIFFKKQKFIAESRVNKIALFDFRCLFNASFHLS